MLGVWQPSQSKFASSNTCLQVRKLPKVNAEEHMRLQAASLAAVDATRKAAAADGAAAEALLQDDRFAAMFEDEEFAIDTGSRTFRELHPNAGARAARVARTTQP